MAREHKATMTSTVLRKLCLCVPGSRRQTAG